MIKVASYTYCPPSEVNSVDTNIQNVCNQLDKIPEKLDLVILPETFNILKLRNSSRIEDYAEDLNGKTLKSMKEKANAINSFILVPILLNQDGKVFNSAVLIDKKGNIASIHNKIYLPKDEINKGISAGSNPTVVKTDFGTIGIVICYELNFDSLRREYLKLKPDLLAVVSMFPGGRLLQSWSLLNSIYMISSTPHEDWGLFIDPVGRIIAQSSYYERLLIRNINLNYKVLHLQTNAHLFSDIKKEYKDEIEISISCPEGLAVIYCKNMSLNIDDICKKHNLQTWQEVINL